MKMTGDDSHDGLVDMKMKCGFLNKTIDCFITHLLDFWLVFYYEKQYLHPFILL